ncbi:alpha/beta fold hydrolase [Metapseudomonas otitidis]|uniref:alpha/beta fold hydrolase n=1 Tax=Metapseudomonas otitidis TaxID=319939 RepID=UPI001F2241A3|nr:alpha/beta fold hydrolase [Pseudomonas otitidis]
MNAPLNLEPQRTLVQGDGVRLTTYQWGNAKGPVLLLVHGYPDNHRVWLPLVRELAADYRIIAYDVRGAGDSEAPRRVRDYRLVHLANDLEAVIRAHSPDRPVHLVAHDWGSIQSWEAVTDPRFEPLLASYTSLSGPCLDHVGHWMHARFGRLAPRGWLQALGQLVSSWYIAFFQTPWLPELCWRLGLARAWPAVMRQMERIREPERNPHQLADGQHGVKLYRANFMPRLFAARQRPTRVPVQLVVQTRDRYVRPQLFDGLERWAPDLLRREVDAGHWQLLARPGRLAAWLRAFVEAKEHDAGHAAP